jgi:uncharacterized protein YlxW (UPF0749 family)
MASKRPNRPNRPANIQRPHTATTPEETSTPDAGLSESADAIEAGSVAQSQGADDVDETEPAELPADDEAAPAALSSDDEASEPAADSSTRPAAPAASEPGTPENPDAEAVPPPDESSVPAAPAEPEPPPTKPHLAARYRAAALIGVLIAALGFAIAVQVHANSQSDSLSNLRADDLIGILDNQNARGDRLRQQISELEQTLRRLQDSGDRNAAAKQQAEQDALALGVLLGTLPASGPGVQVTITDPAKKLQAEDLLDVVEELRGAGAEAIQFGPVRVSTSTAFTTEGGAVAVDGTVLAPPYTVTAIGDPKTLDTALNIPGGIAAAARAAGGDLLVAEQDSVTISVLRSLPTPRYASPAPH